MRKRRAAKVAAGPRRMARADAMDKRERQSCAISKRPITRERNARAKKRNGTRKYGRQGERGWSGKGERMGRDGKLTRSLLPGALRAENKERQTEENTRQNEKEKRERDGREREVASHR